MFWINILGFFDPVTDMITNIINFLARFVYGVYFTVIRSLGWVLDMLTQLFFIFSGMTPITDGTLDSQGNYKQTDIVNFFLTKKEFTSAYLELCLIALGFVIVFTIAKIIKQDYFDRSGPRSKGPIFRSVALSFIAFICVIPIFYFLISGVGALALAVMNAMGYDGGGIGTLLFNISWEDGGVSIQNVALALDGKVHNGGTVGDRYIDGTALMPFNGQGYDKNNMGWMSIDTFYAYYWDARVAETYTKVAKINGYAEFYWYIFLIAGIMLAISLFKMMLAMLSRMYKLIALFIVAPAPISQIVLDDGNKFKLWKDRVLQEAFKVVGCVMSFMLFMMIAAAVNDMDLMRFAFTDESASGTAKNIIDINTGTQQLSNSISALYYRGADEATFVDKAINALGKAMILLGGVGAIQDIDQTITPLFAGGTSSMDMGATGKAVGGAMGAAAGGALKIASGGVKLATSLAAKTVGAGTRIAGGMISNTVKGIGGAVGSHRDAEAGKLGRELKESEKAVSASENAVTQSQNAPHAPSDPVTPNGSETAETAEAANEPTNANQNAEAANNAGDANNADGQGNGNAEGGDDKAQDTPEVAAQKEKVEQAKAAMEEAQGKFDEAKGIDDRKLEITKNASQILDSNMSQADKDAKVKELDDEWAKLDAQGAPKLDDAQKDLDAKTAMFEMEQRKLDDMLPETETPSDAEDKGDENSDAAETPDNGTAPSDEDMPEEAADTSDGEDATDTGSSTGNTSGGNADTGDASSASGAGGQVSDVDDYMTKSAKGPHTLEGKAAAKFGAWRQGRKDKKNKKYDNRKNGTNIARSIGKGIATTPFKVAGKMVGSTAKEVFGKGGIARTAIGGAGGILKDIAGTAINTVATAGGISGGVNKVLNAGKDVATHAGKEIASEAGKTILGTKNAKGERKGGLVQGVQGIGKTAVDNYNKRKKNNETRAKIAANYEVAEHNNARAGRNEANAALDRADNVRAEAETVGNVSDETMDMEVVAPDRIDTAEERLAETQEKYSEARKEAVQARKDYKKIKNDPNASAEEKKNSEDRMNAAKEKAKKAAEARNEAKKDLDEAKDPENFTTADKEYYARQNLETKQKKYQDAADAVRDYDKQKAEGKIDLSTKKARKADADKTQRLKENVDSAWSEMEDARKEHGKAIDELDKVTVIVHKQNKDKGASRGTQQPQQTANQNGAQRAGTGVGQDMLNASNTRQRGKVQVQIQEVYDRGEMDDRIKDVAEAAFAKDTSTKSGRQGLQTAAENMPQLDELEGILNDEELQQAIDAISEAPEEKDIGAYRQDLADRYKKASSSYESAMSQVKLRINQFKVSGKSEDLEAVKQHIADAVTHNVEMNKIKVEIKKDKE